MRLLRRRGAFRFVAALLLLAAGAGVPHLALDDAACLPGVYGAHDESQHALSAAADVVPAEHCAVCHWSRSLRSPRLVITVSAAANPRPAARAADCSLPAAAVVCGRLSPRAPPAAA